MQNKKIIIAACIVAAVIIGIAIFALVSLQQTPDTSKTTLAFIRGDRLLTFNKVTITQEQDDITVRFEKYPLQVLEKDGQGMVTEGRLTKAQFKQFWSNLMELEPLDAKQLYTKTDSYPELVKNGTFDGPPTDEGPGFLTISFTDSSGTSHSRIIETEYYSRTYSSEVKALFDTVLNQKEFATETVDFTLSEKMTSISEIRELATVPAFRGLSGIAMEPVLLQQEEDQDAVPPEEDEPDFDEDGIPDRLDVDDDNDGVPDWQDSDDNDPEKSRDTDEDGIDDTADDDIDGDGTKNDQDPDDDGDGNSDEFEEEALEAEQNLRNRDDPELNEALDALDEQNPEGTDHVDEDPSIGKGAGRYNRNTGETRAGAGTTGGDLEDVIAHEARHAQQDKEIEDGAADADGDELPDKWDPDPTTNDADGDGITDDQEDAFKFEDEKSPGGHSHHQRFKDTGQ